MQALPVRSRPILIAALAGVLLLPACAGDPAKVSDSDLRQTKAAYTSLPAGVSKAEALKRFEKANTVKLGSAEVGGKTIEEWKAEAKSDGELFVAFLYFADDRLIETRDDRWNYRDDPGLPARLGNK